MDANWRRDAIVELLRQKGKVKARELAKRFHVTRQTICQDITVLSLHCDIYTERGQNGGIYLLEKKRPIRKSLSSSQIQVLEQLLPSLSEEKRLIIQSMDEHKRNEMDKMDDLFGISLEISVEQQPYPVLFTVTEEGCKAFAPDFPKIQIQAGTMETALMEAKKQIQKALSQFKYPPIPTRQEDIVVPENSVLILLKTA